MNRKILLFPVVLVFALVSAGSGMAGDSPGKKTVIKLKTDDFEMAETDISHLGIGESETIVTDSGKIIDLLRTTEGVEVYVDGDQLDLGMHGEALEHGEHGGTHKRVKIMCTEDDECEKYVMAGSAADVDHDSLHGEDGEHVIIRKRIEIECDDGEECEEIDIESLDELGETHGVIMIHGDRDHDLEILDEDVDMLHGEVVHKKVYVIKKED